MSPRSWQIGKRLKKLNYIFDLFLNVGLSDQGHEGRWIWQHSLSDVDFQSWADGGDHGVSLDILTQGLIRLQNVPMKDNPDDDCAVMDYDNSYNWVAVR